MDNSLDSEPVNEKMWNIKVKFKYYSLTLISTLPQMKKKMK